MYQTAVIAMKTTASAVIWLAALYFANSGA